MRQIGVGLPAEFAQNFQQQRGRGHAVHVIIAKDDKRFAAFVRQQKPFNGGEHVWQQKRVGEIFEARREEFFDGRRLAQTAVQQALPE